MLSWMRVVAALIVLVSLLVGVMLLRESGGRGAGMVVFAILVVIVLSALPVVLGRLTASRKGDDAGEDERCVVVLDEGPPDGARRG